MDETDSSSHKKTGRSFTKVTALIKRHGGTRPARHPGSAGRRLSDDDREEIALGLSAGDTFVVIAERIGRHHSTVSREVARNGGRSKHRATAETKATVERAKRSKDPKMGTQGPSWANWFAPSSRRSGGEPEQISAWLEIEHPHCDEMRISPESTYVAIYTSTAGMASKHLTCLRQGRKRHRPPRPQATRP